MPNVSSGRAGIAALIAALLAGGGFAAGRMTAPDHATAPAPTLPRTPGAASRSLGAPPGWDTVLTSSEDRAFATRLRLPTASQIWLGYTCSAGVAHFDVTVSTLQPGQPLADHGHDVADIESNDPNIGDSVYQPTGSQFFGGPAAGNYVAYGNVLGAGACRFVVALQP